MRYRYGSDVRLTSVTYCYTAIDETCSSTLCQAHSAGDHSTITIQKLPPSAYKLTLGLLSTGVLYHTVSDIVE
jgi:hypothetical protein